MMLIIGEQIQATQEMMLEDSIVIDLSYLFDKLRQINLYLYSVFFNVLGFWGFGVGVGIRGLIFWVQKSFPHRNNWEMSE